MWTFFGTIVSKVRFTSCFLMWYSLHITTVNLYHPFSLQYTNWFSSGSLIKAVENIKYINEATPRLPDYNYTLYTTSIEIGKWNLYDILLALFLLSFKTECSKTAHVAGWSRYMGTCLTISVCTQTSAPLWRQLLTRSVPGGSYKSCS